MHQRTETYFLQHMKKIRFRLRACACVLSCVQMEISPQTYKCYIIFTGQSITLPHCLKYCVRTKSSACVFRMAECCGDVFTLCGAAPKIGF